MSVFRVNRSINLKKDLKKERQNQKGQISVFLALGFLVLFTMFGMTINVGMIVHDKINIQNAVDFASIYVAQRQAEMLNAIAHFNYQIRQSHKLLSYRYVVLGTAGIDAARIQDFQELQDPYALKARYPACIADDKIMVYPQGRNDNWCTIDRFNLSFPGIPTANIVNGSLGTNFTTRTITVAAGLALATSTASASALNWWFTANIMGSYQNQVSYRKSMIRALATNLTRPIVEGANGMKDLFGESVYEGARKTFEFNLSESSRKAGGFSIQVRNSMENISIREWLPEIATFMIPVYAEYTTVSAIGAFDNLQPQRYSLYPNLYLTDNAGSKAIIDANLFSVLDPDQALNQMAADNYPSGSDYEAILGFEKNPWYMVYNQVEGQVNSGALFSPVPSVNLRAQAFSKPFGGRIGPWFGREWPAGASISSADKNEPLWPNRRLNGEAPPVNLNNDITVLPNAPKYPGDLLGYTSRLAQSSTGPLGGVPKVNRFDINDYVNITFSLFPGRDYQAIAGGEMRNRELSAIAPDLFDITYYSIEPNFDENYLDGKLDSWLPNEANFYSTRGLNYTGPIWRDLGYSTQPLLQNFSVKNQLIGNPNRQSFSSQVFYFLESNLEGLANVLTSWVEGTDVMDYRTPSSGAVQERFGKCQQFFTPSGTKPNVPGECLNNGGRAGYSVKVVSKEYLLSNQHRMSPNSTGNILNPPSN